VAAAAQTAEKIISGNPVKTRGNADLFALPAFENQMILPPLVFCWAATRPPREGNGVLALLWHL
jgi:hypothetical protein